MITAITPAYMSAYLLNLSIRIENGVDQNVLLLHSHMFIQVHSGIERAVSVKSKTIKPHMGVEEWSQLSAILSVLQPKMGLEWGSGGSTKALLENFPCFQKLVTVEHDRQWYEKIRTAITDQRLELIHIAGAEEEPPAPLIYSRFCARDKWRKKAERERNLFEDYINFPLNYGGLFDFILVDGRARVFCLETGWKCLRSGGVMLLHDAQRAEYQPTIRALPTPLFLESWSRGQLCLFVKP